MLVTKKTQLTHPDYNTFFKDIIDTLENRIDLNAFILFGSRARGNSLPHSDYDLVAIGSFTKPFIHRSEWVLDNAPWVAIDMFCYTPEEFDTIFHQYNLTAIDSIDEGIFLRGKKYLAKYKKKIQYFKEKGMRKGDHILFPPHF